MNPKHPQRMNSHDEPASSAFEQQLQRLTPKPIDTEEAETLYACGFRAGRQSVLAELSANQSPTASVGWRPLVLAASLACLMAGPIGYWLGNASSTGYFHVVAENRVAIDGAMMDHVVDPTVEKKSAGDSIQEPSSVPPTQAQTTLPASDVPVVDEQGEPSRRVKQFLAVNSLSHLWQTLVGIPEYELASDRARPQYLTSRSIENLQSVLDQLDTASTWNTEANAIGRNPPTDNSWQNSAAQRLRHLDGFRVPLSNPSSTKDIMQWLN